MQAQEDATMIEIRPDLTRNILDSPQLLAFFSQQYWTKFDLNRNGMLEYNEVQALTANLFQRLGMKPESEDTLARVFTRLDVDRSGTFDMAEFTEFMRSCFRLQLGTLGGAPAPAPARPAFPQQQQQPLPAHPHQQQQQPSPRPGKTIPAAHFPVGSPVQVFSRSQNAWLDAVVVEVASVQHEADGLVVPVGAIKVGWDDGQLIKWIAPEEISHSLREAQHQHQDEQRHTIGERLKGRVDDIKHRVHEARHPQKYFVGNHVQVWSGSQNEWLDATVVEVASAAHEADGLHVPAGAVKVSWENGDLIKWIAPDQLDKMLRPTLVESDFSFGGGQMMRPPQDSIYDQAPHRVQDVALYHPELSPKERLGLMMRTPGDMNEHVSRVFGANANHNNRIDFKHFPNTLQELMRPFGTNLPLRDDRLSDFFTIADTNSSGSIDAAEFGRMVQHMFGEVYDSL